MAEREGFIKRKFKEVVEKGAEFGKKLDYLLIGSGVAVFLFAPGLGAALIIGSAITLIPEEKLHRWAKRK